MPEESPLEALTTESAAVGFTSRIRLGSNNIVLITETVKSPPGTTPPNYYKGEIYLIGAARETINSHFGCETPSLDDLRTRVKRTHDYYLAKLQKVLKEGRQVNHDFFEFTPSKTDI